MSYQMLFVTVCGQIWHFTYLWLNFLCVCLIFALSELKLSLKHTHTHTHIRSHTAVFVVGPTRLRRVDGHFVGVRPNSMLALGSQLEGVGGERFQVLQQVGGGRLEAHFLLKGREDNGTVEDVRL